MTDPLTVDLSMTLPRFLALPEAERQLLLAAGAHFRGNLVVAERLPVGEVDKLPVAVREGRLAGWPPAPKAWPPLPERLAPPPLGVSSQDASDHCWIQTVRGGRFNLLNPRPEQVDILDIAHHLSNICRYVGGVPEFYCPTPDQRILTADLRWRPAGDLKVGDELFAFDEYPTATQSKGGIRGSASRRRWRHGVVTSSSEAEREISAVVLSDGRELRCSPEHPWLISVKGSGNAIWYSTEQIAERLSQGRGTWIREYMPTWAEETSYDAGWLAGMYDGEGHFRFSNQGVGLAVAQKPGALLDRLVELHRHFGFDFRATRSGVVTFSVTPLGGWRAAAKLLGSFRPKRLLEKLVSAVRAGEFDKRFDAINRPIEIAAVRKCGRGPITQLSTSTATYVCEGFAAHNSVAQHSVLVSELCEREAGRGAGRWGLVHDAAEAYLGDLSWPAKQIPGLREAYAAVEDPILRAIAAAFGLPPEMPEVVKRADRRVLLAETRDLLGDPEWAREPFWRGDLEPWPASGIDPSSPEQARREFLRRYERLWGPNLERSTRC